MRSITGAARMAAIISSVPPQHPQGIDSTLAGAIEAAATALRAVGALPRQPGYFFSGRGLTLFRRSADGRNFLHPVRRNAHSDPIL